MRYIEGKLRSLIGQYANDKIEVIESSDFDTIYIKFKEGSGTTWQSDWVESEVKVNNLSDLREACKKEYLTEAEIRLKTLELIKQSPSLLRQVTKDARQEQECTRLHKDPQFKEIKSRSLGFDEMDFLDDDDDDSEGYWDEYF